MIFNQFIAGEGESEISSVVIPAETEIYGRTLWSRPNLTSYSSYGVASGSTVNDPWKAFDSNTSTAYTTRGYTYGQYLRWNLPIDIIFVAGVSQIVVRCTRGYDYSRRWRVFGDTARTIPVTDPFVLLNGETTATASADVITNVFELFLMDMPADPIYLYDVRFVNVYTKSSTGTISDVTIKLLNQYTTTAAEAIQGQTTGYKNDICLYEDAQGAKHLVAVKTGTLPEGAAKNILVSETPLYLNEDKTEVTTEKSGLGVSVEDAYEYKLFDEIGSPTIVDHKYTPSDYNYIVPYDMFYPGMVETWEIHFKVKTPSAFSSHDNNRSRLFNSTEDMTGIMLMTYTDKLKLCLSSGYGESWDIADTTSSLSLNTDTDYYIRAVFDGTKYDVDVSTDDETWTNYISVQSTSIASDCEFFIGVSETEEGCWEGIIYLDDLSVAYDDFVQWKPYQASTGSIYIGSGHKYADESAGYFKLNIPLTSDASQLIVHPEDFTLQEQEHFTVVGNPTITNKVVSGFSSDDYIKLPNTFTPVNHPWQVSLKFKMPDTFQGNQSSVFGGITDRDSFRFGTQDVTGKVYFLVPANSSTWINTSSYYSSWTATAGETYYFRFGYNGTSYYIDVSTDNVTWTNNIVSYTSSTKCSCSGVPVIGKNINRPATGYVYLDSTYITVADTLWWTPYTTSKPGYLNLTKPTSATTSAVLTSMQNPTAAYAGSVCTPASLGKKILLDSTLTNIIGSEDI